MIKKGIEENGPRDPPLESWPEESIKVGSGFPEYFIIFTLGYNIKLFEGLKGKFSYERI